MRAGETLDREVRDLVERGEANLLQEEAKRRFALHTTQVQSMLGTGSL
jgi:hypothetical protein